MIGRPKNDRIGEINYNINNTLMKIVEYNGRADILVEFQDKYKTKVHTTYQNFKKGTVRNPYDRNFYNFGFIGKGNYDSSNKNEYNEWNHMLKRCYNPYYLNMHPTYRNCFIEEYLLNFQNFAKWYEENYYEVPGEKMCLDKDILEKGNKIYDREHIIFVPERINLLFTKNDTNRGNCPIGVTPRNKKYESACRIINKEGKSINEYLGKYDTIEEAFLVYKNFKESYIKQVADEYKDLIPKKLYDAMYKWEVDIND